MDLTWGRVPRRQSRRWGWVEGSTLPRRRNSLMAGKGSRQVRSVTSGINSPEMVEMTLLPALDHKKTELGVVSVNRHLLFGVGRIGGLCVQCAPGA